MKKTHVLALVMLHDLIRVSGHPPIFEECDVEWGNGAADILPR